MLYLGPAQTGKHNRREGREYLLTVMTTAGRGGRLLDGRRNELRGLNERIN